MAIVHVDDFLVTYREDLEALTQHFTWRSQILLSEETPIIFRGSSARRTACKAFIDDEVNTSTISKQRL